MIKSQKSNISGRGIFSTRKIQKGEIIEVCQIIQLTEKDSKEIDKTSLYDYYFSWKDKSIAICWGLGSLYNHSYNPSAQYIKDFKNNLIRFVAIKDIEEGEEIFVNYNGDPLNQEKVWFEKWYFKPYYIMFYFVLDILILY